MDDDKDKSDGGGGGLKFTDEAKSFWGMGVRYAWANWAKTQPNPKPSHLLPWEQLGGADKEADIAIAYCLLVAVLDAIKTPLQKSGYGANDEVLSLNTVAKLLGFVLD